MKRIKICTSRNLNKPGSGEYYKIKSFVFAFKANGYHVEIVNTSFAKPNFTKIWGCEIIYIRPSLIRALKNFIFHFPTSFQRAIYSVDADILDSFSLFSLARTVPYSIVRHKSIVDFADILSINFYRISKATWGPNSWLRSIEALLLRYDEQSIAKIYPLLLVSETECAYGRRKGWLCHHLMQPAPISLDNNYFKNNSYSLNKHNNFLFVGPNNYFPNHEALMMLSNSVVKILKKDWSIHWIGSNSRSVEYKGIISKGYVEDLISNMLESRNILVPIKTSTGIQNKLLDALYLNLNVFTFRKVANPRNFPALENLKIANNDIEFVNLIENFMASSCNLSASFSINQDFGIEGFTLKLNKVCNEYFNC